MIFSSSRGDDVSSLRRCCSVNKNQHSSIRSSTTSSPVLSRCDSLRSIRTNSSVCSTSSLPVSPDAEGRWAKDTYVIQSIRRPLKPRCPVGGLPPAKGMQRSKSWNVNTSIARKLLSPSAKVVTRSHQENRLTRSKSYKQGSVTTKDNLSLGTLSESMTALNLEDVQSKQSVLAWWWRMSRTNRTCWHDDGECPGQTERADMMTCREDETDCEHLLAHIVVIVMYITVHLYPGIYC